MYGAQNRGRLSGFRSSLAMAGCMVLSLVAGAEGSANAQWVSLGVTYVATPVIAGGGAYVLDPVNMNVTASDTYDGQAGETCPATADLGGPFANQNWGQGNPLENFPVIQLAINEYVNGNAYGTVSPGGINFASASSSALPLFPTTGMAQPVPQQLLLPGAAGAVAVRNDDGVITGYTWSPANGSSYGPPSPAAIGINIWCDTTQAGDHYIANGSFTGTAAAGVEINGQNPPPQDEGTFAPSSAAASAGTPATLTNNG
jgi:hypothetical protein